MQMGSIGWANRLVGRRFTPLRTAAAVSVLAAGVCLGAAAAPPPAVASLCDLNSVTGTIHNDTGVSLGLLHGALGITNAWCTFPGNPVAPHSVTTWRAGDNLFETEVHLSYLAPNNDIISLSAASRVFRDPEASCYVIPNGNAPRAYRCRATVSHNSDGGGNNAVAEFTIEKAGP